MLITSFIFDNLFLKDFVVFVINKYPFVARRLLASAIQSGQFLPIMESETIRVGLNNSKGINDLSPNKPKNSSSRMELTLLLLVTVLTQTVDFVMHLECQQIRFDHD